MSELKKLVDRAIAAFPEHVFAVLEDAKKLGQRPVVCIGMSGGVDSSVSAYILKEAGFRVIGVFIKTWQPKGMVCTWKDDRRDAMRVAAQLGIPFRTIYLEEEYKKHVADYMIREYAAGRTPNPDVMCNKYVKFGAFYEAAIGEGADFVATGHYAKSKTVQISRKHEVHTVLAKAKDEVKDQTYFLWAMGQEKVFRTIFPIGALTKPEVRQIAESIKLPIFDKKDSQGVCFIGKLDMKEFLGKEIEAKQGIVLDQKGNEVGSHAGAALYTIGERHGFTLFTNTPDMEPHFIIKKDLVNNELTVGLQKDLLAIQSASEIRLSDVLLYTHVSAKTKLKARIRHRQELQDVIVEPYTDEYLHAGELVLKVIFKKAQQGVASGQSCVLYDGELCVGGGIIM
jgi:tRNA-specific 2-thiouridylase